MSRGPDSGTLLARALQAQAKAVGCRVEITDTEWTRWSSATFAGARHVLMLSAAPGQALDRWLAGLAEAQFDFRGHLVADMTVAARRDADGRAFFVIEALTVEQ